MPATLVPILIETGEYQPAYDDFAAILLLIRTCVHRYGFHSGDLGCANESSFIARLLRYGATSLPSDELSEDQDKHLSVWVGGLYGTENISDELLSSCLPQDFYLIVPTLFDQSIRACMSKVLDKDSLEGGLECELCSFGGLREANQAKFCSRHSSFHLSLAHSAGWQTIFAKTLTATSTW